MQPSIDARLRKSPLSIPLSPPLLGVLGVVLLLIGLFVVWQLRPFVLWAYNLRQAHDYQSVALAYPEPRQSDALPREVNAEANQAALGHFAAAIQWRPDDPYAYRLAGESYIAAGDLLNAVNIMETGIDKAGSDILLGWQLALAYEQMVDQAAAQPGLSLVSRFVAATTDAPAIPVETPYCQPNDPRSCYQGKAEFTHPYSAFPSSGKVTADTLFLHPPARVTIPVDVPTGQPTLTFLLGLDPQALGWGTDGATFQVWVIEPDGGILPVYERTVIGGELTRGWVPDQVDLTPWAGQSIQLALGTTPGSLNNNTGDWVGFGNIYISDAKLAAYRELMPEGRFRDAILTAPILDTQLVGRGDEALYASRFDEASKWYRRAEWTGADITSTTAYAQFLEIKARTDFETAFPYLEQAVTLDKGWGSSLNRFYAYFNYGRWLTEEKVYFASEGYLLFALAIFPDPEPVLYAPIAEVHRFLAIGYTEQGRVDEALEHARKAVTLDPNSFLTQYQYGLALYRKDPTQLPEIEQAFARALDIDASAKNWQTIVLVWLNGGDNEKTLAYCSQALQRYTPEELGYTCWEGGGGASSILYNEYLKLLAEEDKEAAYLKLDETISTNGGWSNATQRFEAWYTWSEYLREQERYEEYIPAAQTTLTYVHEYTTDYTLLVLNRRIANAYVQLERYAEALPYFQTSLSIEESAFLYFDYGVALYYSNPADIGAVRPLFDKAIALAVEEMRAHQIDFWYQEGEVEEAARLCSDLPLTLVEEILCVATDDTDSSGTAYRAYLDIVETDEDRALVELERAVTLDRGWQGLGYRHLAWYLWGEYLWEQENYEDSIIALQTAIEAKDPRVSDVSRSRAASLLGLAYQGNQQIDEAIEAFEQAIEWNPQNAFAYVHLARALYNQDDSNLVRARELIDEALEIAPDDIGIWRTVIGFWAFVDQPEEVARLCEVVPDEIKMVIGDLCLTSTQVPSRNSFFEFSRLFVTDPTAAYQALEIAITTDLGWTDSEQRFTGWFYWSKNLLKNRQFEAAAEAFEFTASITPATIPANDVSEVYRLWGVTLGLLDRVDEGMTQVTKALALNPSNAYAHLNYGQFLYLSDSTKQVETEAAFAKALQLEPERAELWGEIAIFWLDQRVGSQVALLCGNASENIRAVIEIYCWDGTNPPSTESLSIYLEALRSNNPDLAYEALEQAITTDGGWRYPIEQYRAWSDWGFYTWRNRDWESADVALERAYLLVPETVGATERAQLLTRHGLTLLALNRVSEAVIRFEQAIEINPNAYQALFQYGKILYMTIPERRAEGLGFIEEALEVKEAETDSSFWAMVAVFWLEQTEYERVLAICTHAPATIRDSLDLYCWDGNGDPSSVSYQTFVEETQAGNLEAAGIALEAAIVVDGGWLNGSTRYLAWREWATRLLTLKQYEDALVAFQTTIDAAPATVDPKLLGADYQRLGFTLNALSRYDEAVEAFAKAIEIEPNNPAPHLFYGMALYTADERNKPLTLEQFEIVLTLAPDQLQMWEAILSFWETNEETEEVEALCQRAATTPFADDLAPLCTVP